MNDILECIRISEAEIDILPVNLINTMAADALAHCAARPSATPILTVQDNWGADTAGDDSDGLQLIYFGICRLGLSSKTRALSDVFIHSWFWLFGIRVCYIPLNDSELVMVNYVNAHTPYHARIQVWTPTPPSPLFADSGRQKRPFSTENTDFNVQ